MATSATRHVLKNENEVIAIGTGNFVARTERSIAGSRFTKEIYGDLAKPGVSQVGKALGTLFGLGNTLLYPIQLLNDRTRIALNNNLERYRSQIENVPEAEIVAVSSEVGVPVLEKLAYVTDDEISQLYINLLSKASTVETAGLAHPSFVHIINSLSPDEALLLKSFRNKDRLLFLEAQLLSADDSSYRVIKAICTGLEDKIPLRYVGNDLAYFSNFEGLGIIAIRRDTSIAVSSIYEQLETEYRTEAKQQVWYSEDKLKFRRGIIEITPFGVLFITACLSKLSNQQKQISESN